MSRIFRSLLLVVMALAVHSFSQMSLKAKGSDGWGSLDRYEQNFNKFNLQTFYAEVKSIDTVTPLPDMIYGVQLTVTIDQSECFVHLGPAWFILHQDNMSFSKGDKIEIRGSKVVINGKQVIMPLYVKRKDHKLFLRDDDDGVPYWSVWRKQ
jgi:hypothetical protein